ncbi:MAG: stage II sporulation protein M [Eubacterium sp.]|nr:stage II sporulation protein M [Eubacterium sp.]
MHNIIKSEKDFDEIIIENKDYIYPALFYAAGLILGSFCFELINNTALSKLIELVLKVSESSFASVFLNRFFLYFSVYVICVLLGMCLIGFPFINLVPFLIGCELAIKIAYFYVSFNMKGAGFSLLMIIPEGAAVAAVLIYAIQTSASLSKNIFEIAAKGNDGYKIEIKYYLKKYIIYGLVVAAISLVNALASFLIGSIIKI